MRDPVESSAPLWNAYVWHWHSSVTEQIREGEGDITLYPLWNTPDADALFLLFFLLPIPVSRSNAAHQRDTINSPSLIRQDIFRFLFLWNIIYFSRWKKCGKILGHLRDLLLCIWAWVPPPCSATRRDAPQRDKYIHKSSEGRNGWKGEGTRMGFATRDGSWHHVCLRKSETTTSTELALRSDWFWSHFATGLGEKGVDEAESLEKKTSSFRSAVSNTLFVGFQSHLELI